MEEFIKLTPSIISLFLECPRCFYLEMKKKIHRPEGIFPSLTRGMDSVIKSYYDSYRKQGKLPPEIDGKVLGKLLDNEQLLKKWRNNRVGIEYLNEEINALLKGAIDDCLIDKDVYIPIDYKTRGYGLKDDSTSYYQHQLDIYCYLLFKNGYRIADFAYLIFYYPKSVKEDGIVSFEVIPIRVPTDINHAEQIFYDSVACLRGSEPKSHSRCKYCSWGIEAFGVNL